MTRIDEIRARLKAATPGPWDTMRDCALFQVYDSKEGEPIVLMSDCCNDFANAEANGSFVAHSPSDIQFLLDELTRREEQVQIAVTEMKLWCNFLGEGAVTESASKALAAVERLD